MLGMAESHKTEASSKLTTTTERGSEAQQYLPPQCCAVQCSPVSPLMERKALEVYPLGWKVGHC